MTPRPPAPTTADGALAFEAVNAHQLARRAEDSPFTRGPARRPATAPAPATASTGRVAPATADEAAQRFLARYGAELVSAYLGTTVELPTTVAGWVQVAEAVRAVQGARVGARERMKGTT